MAPKRPRPAATKPSVEALPDWPAITRADHTVLDVKTTLPDQLVLLHGLFTPESLKRWRAFMDGLAFEPPRPPRRDEASRSNSRLAFTDAAFAKRLWVDAGLRDAVKDESGFEGATGLSANVRLYSYAAGNAFGRHYDEASKCPVTGASISALLVLEAPRPG